MHVVTTPPLVNCWSLNLSGTGIGLVAHGGAASSSLREEQPIRVSFRLPNNVEVDADGTVAWKRSSPPLLESPEGTVAIGVRFSALSPQSRVALEQFLGPRRFSVVCLGASLGQQERLLEAAGGFANLSFAPGFEADETPSLPEETAGIVVCELEPEQAVTTLRAIHGRTEVDVARTHVDWGPRTIFYGNLREEDAVERFNHGRLAHALDLDTSVATLRQAILQLCRDYEVRLQYRKDAIELARRRRADQHRIQNEEAGGRDGEVVATSQAMRHVLKMASNIARHPLSVLLQGETGTGKEVMSRFIHEQSDRVERPFVVQDCGTLSETLLESELFGHVKGAFTGASHDHPGLFALADGGTVFLDEVENTTSALQSKLLRVLETGEIRPVGGTQVRRVDVRIVCATNRDLRQLCDEGAFRLDLYYRLSAFPIRIPPLRERPDDIVPLARRFLSNAGARFDLAAGHIREDTGELLMKWRWPGNARELRNTMERALVLAGSSNDITPQHLPEAFRRPVPVESQTLGGSLGAIVAEAERAAIVRALAASGGVMVRAAEELKVNRVTLTRKAKRYGIA